MICKPIIVEWENNKVGFNNPASALKRVKSEVINGFAVRVQTDDSPDGYKMKKNLFMENNKGNINVVANKKGHKYVTIEDSVAAYSFVCF